MIPIVYILFVMLVIASFISTYHKRKLCDYLLDNCPEFKDMWMGKVVGYKGLSLFAFRNMIFISSIDFGLNDDYSFKSLKRIAIKWRYITVIILIMLVAAFTIVIFIYNK